MSFIFSVINKMPYFLSYLKRIKLLHLLLDVKLNKGKKGKKEMANLVLHNYFKLGQLLEKRLRASV